MSDVDNLLDYFGGGWLSLVLAVVLGLFLAYLKFAEKKAKRERAQKDTDLHRAKDQADAAGSNQAAQDSWDEGSSEIDRIREEASKNNGNGGGTQ